MGEHGTLTTKELEEIFGGKIEPKWVLVLVPGERIFKRESKDTWYELSA